MLYWPRGLDLVSPIAVIDVRSGCTVSASTFFIDAIGRLKVLFKHGSPRVSPPLLRLYPPLSFHFRGA
jgi:hypothetical protein